MKGRSAWQSRLVPVGSFLAWAVVFSLVVAQEPLYTSNQNLYLLHGAASSGFGFINQDWLANTQDPTPLFSWLVDLTYRFLEPEFFHFYFVLLSGIYLSSLYGITAILFDLENPKIKRLVFLTGLFVLHSAALRFILTNLLGAEWAYLFDGGVASQRLLGSVFQPSCFGVLLMLSLYLFLRRQPGWAVAISTLAASIHPTYLLSAAVLTLTYIIYEIFERRTVKHAIKLSVLSLALVAPILIYSALRFSPTSTEATAQARDLLVNFRIPHHANPSEWLNGSVIIKLTLVATGLWICRKSKLFIVLVTLVLSALSLSLLQQFLQSDLLALLFPWRLSTLLVPLGTALVWAFVVEHGFQRFPQLLTGLRRLSEMTCLLVIVLVMIAGVASFVFDSLRILEDPARLVQGYIVDHKQGGEVYLIPPKMQDFRLRTGAPAFVDFKSHPYKDVEVLEWYRRIRLVQFFYRNEVQHIDCSLLKSIQEVGAVTHVVLSEAQFDLNCSELQQSLYQDQDYALFLLMSQ